MSSNLKTTKSLLVEHDLEQVASVLEQGLKKYFEFSNVSVSECPDLQETPFNLAASGIGGSTLVADIGGPPFLIPSPRKEKIYSFEQIAELVNESSSEVFLIGASASSFRVVGQLCELIPNVSLKRNNENIFEVVKNNTHYSEVNLFFLICLFELKFWAILG